MSVCAAHYAAAVAPLLDAVRHAATVLTERHRWLFLLVDLSVALVFANLSQDSFVMSTRESSGLCMALFMSYYIESLAFIVSFNTQ